MAKTYAHIVSASIVEIITTDEDIVKLYHPALVWVDITDVSPPPDVGWTATETSGIWTFATPSGPTLSQVQATQLAALKISCAVVISTGFTSSALGTSHVYPSEEIDQDNLEQTATSTIGGQLWCKSSTETWMFVAHTQAQALVVLGDFVISRNTQQAKLEVLTNKVLATTSIADAQAVVW